jgi:sporulation protein YlmC with PRC-barrel domain
MEFYMKTTGKKITVWTVAVLSLALVHSSKAGELPIVQNPLQSQLGATGPVYVNRPTPTALQPYTPPSNNNDQYDMEAGAPAKYDRATGIVGMDVRNQNNENLGHVRDVVFDLDSERVSYAVITTHSGFLRHEKLLAVPLSALNISPNGKHLIMNADRAKMQAAAGLEGNDWPSVISPSWGAEPFWQTNPENRNQTTPNQNEMKQGHMTPDQTTPNAPQVPGSAPATAPAPNQ